MGLSSPCSHFTSKQACPQIPPALAQLWQERCASSPRRGRDSSKAQGLQSDLNAATHERRSGRQRSQSASAKNVKNPDNPSRSCYELARERIITAPRRISPAFASANFTVTQMVERKYGVRNWLLARLLNCKGRGAPTRHGRCFIETDEVNIQLKQISVYAT